MNLRLAAAGRLRAWAARRHGRDALPLTIQLRRIYILPTGPGLVLGALVLAMLLAGLNYNSNLGLAFGFLLASMAVVAMHHCHRNLLGLSVDLPATADGFAGAHADIPVLLRNDSSVARHDIEVCCAPGASAMTGVPALGSARAVVALPTPARGVLTLPQCELRTTWPLGWFRAWTYVQAPIEAFVAPRPFGHAALPVAATAADGDAAFAGRRGDDDFAGLAPYAPGIPLKHMAWKTIARGRPAAVRTYVDASGSPQWLAWDALAGLAPEQRLAQLCRWVVDSEGSGRHYGLRLPELELQPDHGSGQRQACLRALAAFKPAAP